MLSAVHTFGTTSDTYLVPQEERGLRSAATYMLIRATAVLAALRTAFDSNMRRNVHG